MKNGLSEFGNRKNEQGVVLLIVLILMVFVAALATDIIRSSRYDYAGAAFLRNTYTSSVLLESAAQASRGIFMKEVADKNGTVFASLSADFSSIISGVSPLLATGKLTGKIEDEDSRFPLNKLGGNATMGNVLANIIINLCTEHGYENGDIQDYAESYVNSVRCWTGNGTSCREDDSYYDSEDPGYARPEGPISTTDELLLIRRPDGWLDAEEFGLLYNGTSSIPGLKDLVTPFSNGPMNINTLKKEIIMGFVPPDWSSDDRIAFYEDVIDARNNADDDKNDWFSSVANSNKSFKKYIPDVGYSSGAARVTIRYDNGIYRSSLMEIFDSGKKSRSIKYKKFGY